MKIETQEQMDEIQDAVFKVFEEKDFTNSQVITMLLTLAFSVIRDNYPKEQGIKIILNSHSFFLSKLEKSDDKT